MTKNESSRRKEANEKAQEIHIDTEHTHSLKQKLIKNIKPETLVHMQRNIRFKKNQANKKTLTKH